MFAQGCFVNRGVYLISRPCTLRGNVSPISGAALFPTFFFYLFPFGHGPIFRVAKGNIISLD